MLKLDFFSLLWKENLQYPVKFPFIKYGKNKNDIRIVFAYIIHNKENLFPLQMATAIS